MRTRRNVYTLPQSDRTLEWYGKAVAAMSALSPSNPQSWQYQGAVHGISLNPIPPALRPFWAQCQHATSFFLPWHRMYLLQFERIVATQVQQLGGPSDWSLPYWNYSDPTQPGWRTLPPAFRSSTLSDGTPNPLFVSQRRPGINAGTTSLQSADVDLSAALVAPPSTGIGGFFGSPAAGHFSNRFGELEATVHNRVHVALGGNSGWMSDPDLAALDPIFWLHHANIDRLWEVWLARDPAHQNLTSAFWLTGVPFDFNDASGSVVTMRTIDVLNLAAPALDYQYDDISDPLVVLQGLALGGAGPVTPMKTPGPNDLAGATLAPVVLDDQIKQVDVPTPVTPQAFKQSANPTAFVAPAPAKQLVQQVALLLEHVTSDALAPVYDVYLNVPTGAGPLPPRDRFVGRAAMFGIKGASNPAGQHAGSGQDFAFDITALYYRLDDQGDVDPQNLRVTFVPVDPAPGAQVQVGRVSLYFG